VAEGSVMGLAGLSTEFWPIAKYNPCHEPRTGRFCSLRGSALVPMDKVDYDSIMARGAELSKEITPALFKVREKYHRKLQALENEQRDTIRQAKEAAKTGKDRTAALAMLDRFDKRRDKIVEEYQQALREVVSEQFAGVSGKLKARVSRKTILPDQRDQIQQEAAWLQKIVGDGVPTAVSVAGKKRLDANVLGRYLYGGPGQSGRIEMNAKKLSPGTFAHEYGHHIEMTFPELIPLSMRFQDAHRNVPMFDYARKRYHHRFELYDSTEVVSVGVGELYRNPLAFMRKTSHHFEYTLGVLSAVASKSF